MRSSSEIALGVAIALLLAAPASAQTPYEIATLGPRHAAEHAAARAAMPAEITRRAALVDAAADVVGRWSEATIPLPTFAINAVLLPTGKVAFWGRPPLLGGKRENLSQFWLWDPVTGGLSRRDAPLVDLDGDGVRRDARAAVLLGPVAARRRPALRRRRQPRQPGLAGRLDAELARAGPRVHVRPVE